MQTTMQKTLKVVLALSLMAAFVGALNLFTHSQSSMAMAAAAAAPAANSAQITFKNSRNQEIGEGRPFPLDRVTRGERYALIVDARNYPVKIQVRAANGYHKDYTARGWFCEYDTVSTNPSFDNVIVTVIDPANGHQLASRRLPIGTK